MKMYANVARLEIGHLFTQGAVRGHPRTLDTFLVYTIVSSTLYIPVCTCVCVCDKVSAKFKPRKRAFCCYLRVLPQGGGYSDYCLPQVLELFGGFQILNFANFRVSRFCQLFVWV